MFKLVHTDVDGYIDCRAEFDTFPTEEELYDVLFAYHTEKQCDEAAESLIRYGSAEIGDSSNTTYELI